MVACSMAFFSWGECDYHLAKQEMGAMPETNFWDFGVHFFFSFLEALSTQELGGGGVDLIPQPLLRPLHSGLFRFWLQFFFCSKSRWLATHFSPFKCGGLAGQDT